MPAQLRTHGRGVSTCRCAGQRGFTLIETLVALALVGIAFFGIAAGILTTMSVSSGDHSRVGADNALITVTEAMKTAPYVTCATPAVLQPPSLPTSTLADGRAYTVTIKSVSYWNPATGHQQFESGPCPVAGSTKDAGSELITVRVRVGPGSATGSVVVRNPAATP